MQQKTKFEELRVELLNDVINIGDVNKLGDDFKKKFFKIIEFCNFSLMNEEENFFGNFVIKMNKSIKWDIDTAIATKPNISTVDMYFNPYIFLNCTLKEMKALIKHEIYHILSFHHIRVKKLKGEYSSLAINIAMDISINSYIENLPVWAERISNVNLAYNLDLEVDDTLEEYARKIQEAIDKKTIKKNNDLPMNQKNNHEEHDSASSHDVWENTIYNEEDVKKLVKKIADSSKRKNIPLSIDKIMKDIDKEPEINWKDYIRKLMGTIPMGKKKTSTRLSRRQPNRLDIRGSLSKHIPKILVALDISGSMSNGEINSAMKEILSIVKNYKAEIEIIECDTLIRRIYKVNGPKDIKEKVNTKGGTRFSPVFKYINENNMKDTILIYFTDGVGEKELEATPINFRTIWVLTGKEDKLSLNTTFGVVKKLKYIDKEEEDVLYMKNKFKQEVWVWHDSARM